MSLKNSVLQLLEENRRQCLSGQQIAVKLSVSRSAVWKAITLLRRDGYQIHATTNKGYQLADSNDFLSAEGMIPFLKEEYKGNSIFIYKSTDSTNQQAKLKAIDGAKHGTVVMAEMQTAGKGRLGRSFHSPAGAGIYMSIILRPETDATNAVLITTAAAVAVCKAVKNVCDVSPCIKWLNDVFLDNKKICGILSEAVTNCENGMVESVVVGIGINFKADPSLPDELKDIVGSIFQANQLTATRNHLAAAVINEMLDLSKTFTDREFLKEYKELSFVLGESIKYYKDNIWHEATAIDIADNGGLIVKDRNGNIQTLFSGEISVRKQ
jgi:BirA family biotin operon repressor/biotin-[acetyl-CoA-carboxylase] ligase